MIHYANRNALKVLLQLRGSVLPRTLGLSAATCSCSCVLVVLRRLDLFDVVFGPSYLDDTDFLRMPYAIDILSMVLVLLLTVRTNMALDRWMHGIEEIETMLSMWSDAYIGLCGYFAGRGAEEESRAIQLFLVRIAHWFSLMSCLAFATCRGRQLIELDEVQISEYDSNEVILFTHRRPQAATLRRILCCEGWLESALEPVRLTEDKAALAELVLRVLSAPTAKELELLEMATDKVNAVCLWIVQGIVQEVRCGRLDTSPAIVTRTFQQVSDGMLGFNQAHKVAMTPFPFPFAQIITMMLLIFCSAVPFYVTRFTLHPVFGPLLSFLIPCLFCGLNLVAIELEEPFGIDLNDININDDFHEKFVEMLADVLRQDFQPPGSATSSRAARGSNSGSSSDASPRSSHSVSV